MNAEDIRELANLAQDTQVCWDQGGLKHLPNIGTMNGIYYDFLWLLVERLQPHRIVELGCYEAVSTCVMADASQSDKVQIVTVDVELRLDALERIRRYPNVIAIQGNSHRVPKVLPISNLFVAKTPEGYHVPSMWIDLLYIDSEHSYDCARGEWDLWGPMVRPGGLIVCDDIDLHEGMEQFWGEITYEKVSLPELHHTGFGVIIKQ